MKKVLSLILCIALLGSCVALTSCDGEKESVSTVKFGSAVYVSGVTATDATADKPGAGEINVTIAAVSVDADGKIVACALDTAQNKVSFDTTGKAAAAGEFKTKYELGADYNMVAYGGATKEWFEQADAFEGVVAGKTLDEVKALLVDGYKGNDEVIAAGCTIGIADFVGAVEKAYNAASDEIAADATLKVTAYTEQTNTDATADKDGSAKVSTTIFAGAVDAAGKVVAADVDCVEITFTFTTEGKSTLDTAAAVQSKYEKGDNYGMVAYGGATMEWYAQADAFAAACIGKTGAEIAGLTKETAGCTMDVTAFVKAASKI